MNTVAAEPRHVFRIGALRLCVGTSVCRNLAIVLETTHFETAKRAGPETGLAR